MTVLSVTELVGYLREVVERESALADVFVEGEVSNSYRSTAGHLYFTLKDTNAAIKCVFFRRGKSAHSIADGDHVVVHGRLSVYEARGELQIVADLIEPAGLGALQLQFELLKARLEAEGLFDPSRKRPLPAFPRRIALVTSPSGAVLHDIYTIIAQRYPLVELVLAPCQVQGDAAPAQIAEAIARVNARDDIDLIIVARGGGSAEDLWCFNDERVARAIFSSRIPVVSAVGHETDFTIADYVADLRAPTPSAAAMLCVPDITELQAQLESCRATLVGEMTNRLAEAAAELRFLRHRLDRAAPDLNRLRQQVDDLGRRLGDSARAMLQLHAAHLAGIRQRLETLSPAQTLARGYAVVENATRHAVVRRATAIEAGDTLRILFVDGTVRATANAIELKSEGYHDE
ncbi:MAG: exodeoxyribonuclease VII large subunit [Chloroflexota bacterium]|nr:exodeoxyribonuclease VII large subunit [Dehalococcoidia bacterium]MDW8253663.1 exodeoxyribonuclease VII large subunit [Chloroflexota bacterium]